LTFTPSTLSPILDEREVKWYEQYCNAEALRRLGIPVVKRIDKDFDKALLDWVDSSYIYHAEYENNVPSIVERILGMVERN